MHTTIVLMYANCECNEVAEGIKWQAKSSTPHSQMFHAHKQWRRQKLNVMGAN